MPAESGQVWQPTIRVYQELVAAEKEYYSTQHNEYAQKFFSDEGQHNGLYWKAADSEPQSPSGRWWHRPPLRVMPNATTALRLLTKVTNYRILTGQGKNGRGGAKNYIVNGKMTEGFAFVAYPAEYRSSGVMTMIVNTDGVVYQEDLGQKTDVLAKAMKEYDANSSWQKAEEQREETAAEQKTK